MAGALAGIRVIDFGQYIAGPLTAMLLGDNGAEVIRVDPPSGPMWKTPANATWNRGKKSIVLDLKQPADLAIAQRLIDSADVVIENFRPGVMERLGIGPMAMTAVSERLVYCSIPGLASDDPRAGVAAYEGVIAAATDTYRAPRVPGADPSRPTYTPLPVASNFAAFHSAVSITAALIARERDGLGQRIEVPLYDAMFEAYGRDVRRSAPTAPGGRVRAIDPRGGGTYQCADDRWIYMATFQPRFITWFVEAAGVGEWHAEGVADPDKLMADPELQDQLRRRLRLLFRSRTAQEWEDFGRAAGIPLAMCRTSQEWIENEHARSTRAVVEVDDPELGPMWQAGFAVSLSSTPSEVHPRVELNASHDEVIASLDQENAAPAKSGQPLKRALEGITVVDTTQVLAGPTAGRILADLGADVIKVNNPRDAGIGDHLHLNRGKRTMLLDLQAREAVDILYRLVDGADVFMQNFTYGQAEKLGFSYEQMRRQKADILYASVSAYNYDGPWASGRGYEPMGHAVTGSQLRAGGGVPAGQPYAINDYGTGALGAFAIVLGLFHKARTGEGQHVQASLAQTGTMHQTPYFSSYAGKLWDEPSGPGVLGTGPLYRLYRASDAWFFLGARPSLLPTLSQIDGLEGIEKLSGQELEQALELRFAGAEADLWVERLRAAGAGAHKVTPLLSVLDDPWAAAHGLFVTQEYEGKLERSTGPSVRLSRTPVHAVRFPKPYGGDGAAILAELGLGDRVDELADRRIVAPSVMTNRAIEPAVADF